VENTRAPARTHERRTTQYLQISQKKLPQDTHAKISSIKTRERERENREHTHTHTQRDLKEGKSANFELRREKIKEGKSRLNILISGH
jgi:hypothetical protein